ncbi:hypothetical protein D3C87_1630390 [compost metagenome]
MIHVPLSLTAVLKASPWFTMEAVVVASAAADAAGAVEAAALAAGAADSEALLLLLDPHPDSRAAASPATKKPFTTFIFLNPLICFYKKLYIKLKENQVIYFT